MDDREFELSAILSKVEIPWWGAVLFFTGILVLVFVFRKADAGTCERLFQKDYVARCLGLLGILLGVSIAYLVAYPPLRDALNHERQVTVPRGGVALAAGFLFLGTIALLAGKHSPRFLLMRHGQQPDAIQTTVIVVGVIASLALEFGAQAFLAKLGYAPWRP